MTSQLQPEASPTQAAYLINQVLHNSQPEHWFLIRTMLQLIAWAMRPLNVHEMSAVLATLPESEMHPPMKPIETLEPNTIEQLLSSCAPLIKLRGSGMLCFREHSMKDLIRSSDCTSLGFDPAEVVQERMAAVCLAHLRCGHDQTILRPWVDMGRFLSRETSECQIRSYATRFWQHHYRLAESSSAHLPAVLHRTLQAAINAEEDPPHVLSVCSGRKSSVGLWICSLYDLKVLGRTYLEMGADVEFASDTNNTPLHVAVGSSSTHMLRLLLDRGANLESRNTDGLTPLHLAYTLGNLEVVSLIAAMDVQPDLNHSIYQSEKGIGSQGPDGSPWLRNQNGTSVHKVLNNLASSNDMEASSSYGAGDGHQEVLDRFLIDYGADIKPPIYDFDTTKLIAIAQRQGVIVNNLVDSCAVSTSPSLEELASLRTTLHQRAFDVVTQEFQLLHVGDGDSPSSGRQLLEHQDRSPPALAMSWASEAFSHDIGSDVEDDWTLMEPLGDFVSTT